MFRRGPLRSVGLSWTLIGLIGLALTSAGIAGALLGAGAPRLGGSWTPSALETESASLPAAAPSSHLRSLAPEGANTVVATIPGLSAPAEGAFDPANGNLYFPDLPINVNSSNLTVVSGSSQSIVAQLFLGPYSDIQTPTYVPSNQEVYVPDQNGTGFSNNVSALTGVDQIVANIDTGNSSSPTTGVYDPVNQYLYVSDQSTANVTGLQDNVTVINTATNSVVAQILVGLDPTPGVYDSADGDIYVPNSDLTETNLSVIDASTDTVVATIGGFQSPVTPTYDPVDQEVYIPNSEGFNLTVVKGTTVVATLDTNFDPGTPTVDPVTGEVYVPDYTENDVLVYAPTSNALVANISGGVTYVQGESPTFDPVNDEMYVPAENGDGTSGFLDAIDTTTNAIIASIGVGSSPQTATFDSINADLYVPSLDDNNVSVISGGTVSTSPPGTYPVTFSETGLNSGVYWNVLLNGTVLNRTISTITFDGILNGTHEYVLGPWGDVTECVLNEASIYGNVTVAGAPANVPVSFTCASESTTGGGSGPGFLGLSGDAGYLLVGGVAAAAVAAAVAVLLLRPHPPRGGLQPVQFPPSMPPPPPPPPTSP